MGREQAIAHGKPRPGLTVWFTGLSGAGKTTICRYVQMELATRDMAVEVLDGDVVRDASLQRSWILRSRQERKYSTHRACRKDADAPRKNCAGGGDFALS